MAETRTGRQVAKRPSTIVSVVVALALLVWWQFPTLAGHGGRTDVLIMSDGFLRSHDRPMTLRIHEDGYSLAWGPEVADWCSVPSVMKEVVHRFQPTTVVLSFGTTGTCGDDARRRAIESAGDRSVVIVRQPGAPGQGSVEAGVTVVDPARLVGETAVATSMSCQWWESCGSDGKVEVRDARGELTADGADRVARMLVAQLP
jgi:hypothetical protein